MIRLLSAWRLRRRIIAAAQRLSPIERSVLADSARDALTYEQIARRRSLSVEEVRGHLRSALLRLDESLYPEDSG